MNIIHLLSWHELLTPLVRTQLFERAKIHNEIIQNQMGGVEVWVPFPLREIQNRKIWNFKKNIHREYPYVNLRYFFGIDRLKGFPVFQLQWIIRKLVFHGPVLFHSRGSGGLLWAFRLRDYFKDDKVIYDVRGADPLEAMARKGFFNVSDCDPQALQAYEKSLEKFKINLEFSDGVLTVSDPLKDYIYSNSNVKKVVVSPCCVSEVGDGSHFTRRTSKISVLYLGGVQSYQHLEDLVLPFLAALKDVNPEVVPHIFSHKEAKMRELIEQSPLKDHKYILKSISQKEVAEHLTDIDLGLLLRAPTDLNKVAQPVKYIEYLAAGVGVVVEKGTGVVPGMVEKYNVGLSTQLYGKGYDGFVQQATSVLNWFNLNGHNLKERAQKLAREQYTWESHAEAEITYFNSILAQGASS